jgi:hypothetical protein
MTKIPLTASERLAVRGFSGRLQSLTDEVQIMRRDGETPEAVDAIEAKCVQLFKDIQEWARARGDFDLSVDCARAVLTRWHSPVGSGA